MRAAQSTVRLCVPLVVVGIGVAPGTARAQTPTPAEQTATTAPVGCTLTGTSQLGPKVAIFDAQQGGKAIARFTGGESPLRLDAFPSSPGRARVATGVGTGGFRVTGYVDTALVPVFTRREIPVVEGHLWIGAQREVRVLLGTATRLQVEKSLTHPLNQKFKGWGPCDAFSLRGATPPGWDVPGNARGWKVKQDTLDLFDSADRDHSRIATLSNASGMLLWGVQQRGSYVKLRYHGEISIDAWASTNELNPLPWGEREDALLPPVQRRLPPRLKLAEVPREVTTTKSVPIRTAPGEKGAVIGVIEPNTETYVLEVVVGWASVLPKTLHVAPAGDGQFWAPAGELGLGD